MEVKASTSQVRLFRWSEIIRARDSSGKSVRKYCKENGIAEKTYYYWQRKLRECACDIYSEIKKTQVPCVPTVANSSPCGVFAEVVLSPSKEGLVRSTPSQSEVAGLLRVEIGEIRVTTDSYYPVETLAQLLKGLSRS